MQSRPAKRTRNEIQNIANQLAQIAAGWEASFDGSVLLKEPAAGTYVIDLARHATFVNGHTAELGMTRILDKWIQGELGRLHRDRDWLNEATVAVAYELVRRDQSLDADSPRRTSEALVANLAVSVSIATPHGKARAAFTNAQALIDITAESHS